MPRAKELDIQFIDEQAFIERIFLQYKNYVKHLARKKCGDPNDVEDVVQSTWELLLKNVDKLFAVSENKQMAYIAAVVTNVIRMEAERKSWILALWTMYWSRDMMLCLFWIGYLIRNM